MTVNSNSQERISHAVREWMHKLNEYPGWEEWKRLHIGYTLNFDDNLMSTKKFSQEFKFSLEIEREHAVVALYLELLSTANALRDVEWYFRRYPFSRAPVSRESHLRYCCEMYFGRFYQFKERLKKLSKALKDAVPDHGLAFGQFIRAFEKEFEEEIKARNGVHHHEAFDEVAISRIALFELAGGFDGRNPRSHPVHAHYRRTANEWALRVKRRSKTLDQYVEALAEALLKSCPFLVVRQN